MTVNPIPSYTVSVDANGVLAQLVKQPYDNTPSEDESGCKYCEKFKGPYDKVRNVLDWVKTGDTLSAAHAALNTNVGLSEQIGAPSCPTRPELSGATWRVTGIRVEECEAGDHCFLYIDYSNQVNGEEELADDPWQEVWNLSWQSYSVDPYNFASNQPNQAYACSPSFETDPSAAKPPDSWNSTAMRAHIDQYLNTMPETKTVDGKQYYYYTPDKTQMDSRYFLNDVEVALMKKKQLGRSATYHYPILVHTTVKKGDVDASYDDGIGEDIDHVLDGVPEGCPYTFEEGKWTWVKIGDDMQQQKIRAANQTVFTRREMFAGFTAVDMNFYGNGTFAHTEEGILSGRWEIEKL